MIETRASSSSIDAVPAGGPPRSGGRGAVVLLMLMAFAFLSHVNRIGIATAGDARIMREYSIAPTRMGMVYSAFLLTYTLCMIPGGLLIDRFGARAALMVVGLGSATFVALTGLVGLGIRDPGWAFLALLIVRGAMGAVSAPLHPACARAVGHWSPPDKCSRFNGLVTGAALLGIAATPPGFGALIDRVGWPSAFLIAAGLTVVLSLTWAKWAADQPPGMETHDAPGHPQERDASSWWPLLRHRGLILLTLSYAAVSYFQYLFFYWMGYYFEAVLHLPVARSRAYAAILPLAMAAGMPLGGWLSDRLEAALGSHRHRRLVPMAGMSAGAVLLGLGVLAREPAWIVALFALALGAVGLAEGPSWSTAVELGGRRGGSSAAVFNTGGNAGGILAPILTPWVGERLGWGYALGLGAAICLVGVALWLGINPGPRPDETAPGSISADRPPRGHLP
jgi:MFS family permease